MAAVGAAGEPSTGALDDVTLVDRARTELFRDQSVPKGSINLNAERGTLVLRGEVPTVERAIASAVRPSMSTACGASATSSPSPARSSRRSRPRASARAQDGSERSARWTVSASAPPAGPAGAKEDVIARQPAAPGVGRHR